MKIFLFILIIFMACVNNFAIAKTNDSKWKIAETANQKKSGQIKTKRTALIVIDYQNFNANKKGFLGTLFQDRDHAIDHTKAALQKARKAGIPIIYLNTILNPKLMPTTPLFSKLKNMIPWDQLSDKQMKWNFDIIEKLKPHKGDFIVVKGSWSNGFYNTNLPSVIRALHIRRLIFTGNAEPIAIYGTFLGAWDYGLESIMLSDCIMAAGINPDTQKKIHHFSSKIFYPMMGAKVTTSQYLTFIN